MKLHERHDITVRAKLAIQQRVTEVAGTLTYAELIAILAEIIQLWTKFQIRGERAEAQTK